MRYISDHDYHIHSQLSLCSGHPEQTTANILKYGEDNNFKHICLTDHYWDENVPGASTGFYGTQNNAWIDKALPLPESDKVKFHFGVETDMDKHMVVGVSEKMMDRFEFIIIPTTHLHMMGFTLDEKDGSTERRAELYVERFARLMEKDLPWHKALEHNLHGQSLQRVLYHQFLHFRLCLLFQNSLRDMKYKVQICQHFFHSELYQPFSLQDLPQS